jgi:hypothetical protein
MQLDPARRTSPLRSRLNAAACLLLAAGAPAAAQADGAANPKWLFEGAGLLYGEKQRTTVIEPLARITRLFPDGQTLSAQLALDAITGASPSGALPPGKIQTTTTPSGNTRVIPADQIPTSSFHDFRGALDLDWLKPLGGHLSALTGGHVSREKDYQSLGVNTKLSVEIMQRLTTLSVGAGYNDDTVLPVGGIPVGLSNGEVIPGATSTGKQSTTGVVGVSRVLTRRWMIAVDASGTAERGYLTEPYKVVSLVDPHTGQTVGELKEKRPSDRNRRSVLLNSVYHLTDDILYASYRYYWDDWHLQSNTVDVKYRHDLESGSWLQPHVRFYAQGPADFFTYGLVNGAPLPEYATSDYRLGTLRTVTIGGTYGFHVARHPGEFGVRAEYLVQWGDGHPKEAVGIQQEFDLAPPLSIGTVMLTYTVTF